MRPQSLAGYFPNKAAVYDALIEQSLAMILDADDRAYREHPPGWAQVETWFAYRIELMIANPDLYHLTFDAPVPDYAFPERLLDVTRTILMQSRQMVANAVATGEIQPGVPIEQATDLLIAMRRGLLAERIGKRRYLVPGSGRFLDDLLTPLLQILKTAWSPANASSAPEHAPAHSEGDAHP
jgi:AcrR family transcriptional regulator